jgi:glutamate carboxypeptidase
MNARNDKKSAKFGGAPMQRLLTAARGQSPAMVGLLKEFVECESPSHDKAAVDRCGDLVAHEWSRHGARVSLVKQKARGNHVRAEILPSTGQSTGQILVLGHIDTVYPLGTLRKMPFRVSGGKAWGPGTFDMKGGLALALFAADLLRMNEIAVQKRLVFLWTSDEEVGSETSRDLIEKEAKRSDAVLVLEPALGAEGKLKTERAVGTRGNRTGKGRECRA